MHKKDAYVQQALNSGAKGYVLKTSPSSQIFDAIRLVCQGNYYLSPGVQTSIVDEYLNRKKTAGIAGKRIRRSVGTRTGGVPFDGRRRSTKEMAELLCISPKTVEKHRSSVMKKIGLKNILEMMKYAVKIGIIDPELWDE